MSCHSHCLRDHKGTKHRLLATPTIVTSHAPFHVSRQPALWQVPRWTWWDALVAYMFGGPVAASRINLPILAGLWNCLLIREVSGEPASWILAWQSTSHSVAEPSTQQGTSSIYKHWAVVYRHWQSPLQMSTVWIEYFQMDTHLALDVKSSSFNVKDLLELPEHKAAAVYNSLSQQARQQQQQQQQQAAAVAKELVSVAAVAGTGMTADSVVPSINAGGSVTSDPHGQHQHQPQPPAVNHHVTYFDQDNPYTRWLHNNENMQYTSKYIVLPIICRICLPQL